MEYAMTLRHEYNEGKAEGLEQGKAEGLIQGEERSTLRNIRSLMDNPELHCTPEKAMNLLNIPQEDRDKYLKLLKQ